MCIEKIYFCDGPNLVIKQGHHLNTIHDVSINYQNRFYVFKKSGRLDSSLAKLNSI